MNSYLTIEVDGMLGIPYSRPADDPESTSYIDLKEDSSRVSDIPEAGAYPEFQTFLETVNGSISFFRTLGCITMEIPSDEMRPVHEFRSYTDVGFEVWELGADPGNCFTIFHRFNDYLKALENQATAADMQTVSFRLNLKPAYNSYKDVSFWSMDWWVYAYGETPEDARREWTTAITKLQDFLIQISPPLRAEYEAGTRGMSLGA